jgi:hypothetical protein
MTPCRLAETCQLFEGIRCLQLQGANFHQHPENKRKHAPFESSVNLYQAIRRHVLEYSRPIPDSTRQKNLKSQKLFRLKISQISQRMRLIKTMYGSIKNEVINRLESVVFACFRCCDNATWWQLLRLSGGTRRQSRSQPATPNTMS